MNQSNKLFLFRRDIVAVAKLDNFWQIRTNNGKNVTQNSDFVKTAGIMLSKLYRAYLIK